MCCLTRVPLLTFTTAVLWLQHASSFTVRPSTSASRNPATPVHREHRRAADVFSNSSSRMGCATISRRRRSSTSTATELRGSDKDNERDRKFERDLDRDAQLWVNGDPKKQELWDKAKSWRNLNKSEHGSSLQYNTAVQVHLASPMIIVLSVQQYSVLYSIT